MNIPYLRYFTLDEYKKTSLGDDLPDDLLVDIYEILSIVDEIRHHYGHPLRILIGGAWRSQDANSKIGGSKNSQHIYGRALDLRPVKNCSEQEILNLKALTEKLLYEKKLPTESLLGIGVYLRKENSFIHIDCRKGVKARWVEDK